MCDSSAIVVGAESTAARRMWVGGPPRQSSGDLMRIARLRFNSNGHVDDDKPDPQRVRHLVSSIPSLLNSVSSLTVLKSPLEQPITSRESTTPRMTPTHGSQTFLIFIAQTLP